MISFGRWVSSDDTLQKAEQCHLWQPATVRPRRQATGYVIVSLVRASLGTGANTSEKAGGFSSGFASQMGDRRRATALLFVRGEWQFQKPLDLNQQCLW